MNNFAKTLIFKEMRLFLFSLTAFALFTWGCHTFVFQPVKKQIEGTWIADPQDTVVTKWTFSGGSLVINVNGVDTTTISYTVKNKITKHLLVLDKPLVNETRFVIVKVNKTQLYLASESKPNIANYQQGFTR